MGKIEIPKPDHELQTLYIDVYAGMGANTCNTCIPCLIGNPPQRHDRSRDPRLLHGQDCRTGYPRLHWIPVDATLDQLNALNAALPASGSVSMFHAVGVTPEAPTLEKAFNGQEPKRFVYLDC